MFRCCAVGVLLLLLCYCGSCRRRRCCCCYCCCCLCCCRAHRQHSASSVPDRRSGADKRSIARSIALSLPLARSSVALAAHLLTKTIHHQQHQHRQRRPPPDVYLAPAPARVEFRVRSWALPGHCANRANQRHRDDAVPPAESVSRCSISAAAAAEVTGRPLGEVGRTRRHCTAAYVLEREAGSLAGPQ